MTRKSAKTFGPKSRTRPPSWKARPEPMTPQTPSDIPSVTFRRQSAELAVIYGFHAVREALRVKRRKLLDVYATKAAAEKLAAEIAAVGLSPHIVDAEILSRRLGANAVHQGIM